jgi:aerobic-type carbon monoxide dehydrogenase small subunit (CoxS/CutS family)
MTEPVDVTLVVNGAARQVSVPPRYSLADAVRERVGLVGTHVGCEQGVCGSCTVLVDEMPARSCLVLAVSAEGSRVRTVEGLADGEGLDDLQEQFRRHHGLQCGFCTPGFLMSITHLLELPERPTPERVEEMLEGVACRCTGYVNIKAAALAAVEARFGGAS